MTFYIDQLSQRESDILTRKLGYSPYGDCVGRGHETYHCEGYKTFHSWNHSYISSKDYDDIYLCISDYDVKGHYNRQEKLKILFSYMYDKFGNEWANKAIKHLTGKKAMKSVQYIQMLMNKEKINKNELSK